MKRVSIYICMAPVSQMRQRPHTKPGFISEGIVTYVVNDKVIQKSVTDVKLIKESKPAYWVREEYIAAFFLGIPIVKGNAPESFFREMENIANLQK